MKGIIVEIKDNEAAVFTDNGIIHKIKNQGYQLGEVVFLKEKSKFSARAVRWGAGIVAALALFTVGAFAYTNPVGYVSLDINPSVEFSINMFDRVLEVKGINDDGKEFLTELNLSNKHIGKAIEEITAILIEENYITDGENGGVVITTSGSDTEKAEKLAVRLKVRIQECIDQKGKNTAVEAEAVGLERVKEAREFGVTPGKLNLVQKLIESSDDPEVIDMEEWLGKSVKEINEMIKENRNAARVLPNDEDIDKSAKERKKNQEFRDQDIEDKDKDRDKDRDRDRDRDKDRDTEKDKDKDKDVPNKHNQNIKNDDNDKKNKNRDN